MDSSHTLSVVRRYHSAWTSKDFAGAIDLLSPELVVEVPINEYPTAEAFGEALRAFGAHVAGVELLAEMSAGSDAMLLYDMQVDGLGELRVAEHFTVETGRIVRLRQIHDTAAIRAAGIAA